MKRLVSIPVLLVSMCLGLALSAALEHLGGCQSGGLSLPTTQQSDALVATAQQDVAQAKDVLAQAKAAAATQPSNTELQKQVTTLQKVVDGAQKGVDYAGAVNAAVNHNDVSGVAGIVAAAVPGYGPLIAMGLSIGYGVWQNRKAAAADQAHADTQTALQQYAQTVHAVAPDAIVSKVSQIVDASTRAQVAATGVVHVPDDVTPIEAAVATLQPAATLVAPAPAVQGVPAGYTLTLTPTTTTGH